ncbi:hypothetical protein B296_00038931 [Ensete ventricosum]|uniref:Uncharacterized protein n=1 Tax=Ensete ventricosum TaxID=4639 RepID=A0A426XZZ7_ENSVE|nr:hypothetical protein B296_00038931 [Ensete ventricosum]
MTGQERQRLLLHLEESNDSPARRLLGGNNRRPVHCCDVVGVLAVVLTTTGVTVVLLLHDGTAKVAEDRTEEAVPKTIEGQRAIVFDRPSDLSLGCSRLKQKREDGKRSIEAESTKPGLVLV